MKILILVFITALFSGCATHAKIDQDKLASVKKVAVVVFTLKKSIEHRDDPTEDDSDWHANLSNATTKGDGVTASTLAFPRFVSELNSKGLPFNVMTLDEMKGNAAYMELYTPPKQESTEKIVAKETATLYAKTFIGGETVLQMFSGAPDAASPSGIMNFGLPEDEWDEDDNALTGAKGEMEHIKKSIKALGVDAALVIVDRGTSFQCNLACVMGTGDSSMGGAFYSSLILPNGEDIAKINFWFEGDAHAGMVTYVVNPLQRESLYKAHGKKMGEEYVELFLEQRN